MIDLNWHENNYANWQEQDYIYDMFYDRMTEEDMKIFAQLRRWDCFTQVSDHVKDTEIMNKLTRYSRATL